ncbi:MAG: hypothetical protein HC819_15790 [Cyclobacteriaceae bacterium]|nr:hypothetical protein [Cyclobacteriaceae bacterium]
MKILILIILGTLLAAATYGFRKGKNQLKKKNKTFGYIIEWLPIIELVVWACFFFWASGYLAAGTMVEFAVQFLLITLIFVLASWYLLRDYLAGIQIKSRFRLSAGQYFKSAQGSGQLRKVGVLLLEIKTDSGCYLKVPYAQIDQKSIIVAFEEKLGGEVSFKMILPNKYDERETRQKITRLILNSPWSAYKTLPDISVSAPDGNHKTYTVSCVSTVQNGGIRIKELIRQSFTLGENELM